MKYYLAAAAMLAVSSGAYAQPGQMGSHNPYVKESRPHEIPAPARGANSFTENQARGRFMKAGYSHISDLRKDSRGVWRGSAMRGHKRVNVGLDYKGNIVR